MELPIKFLEEIVFITRPKIEEHMLIIMDQSTHEEHLFQPLQTHDKQFKIAITFLSAYNGIFNVTNSNNKFYFFKSITDDSHIQITIRPGVYEIEALNDEIRRIVIDEGYYTEVEYPFHIKPDFNTLGSIIEISPQGPVISFTPNDSIGELLGFNKTTIYGEYNFSQSPVDIKSFDNIFIETNVARGMIFRGRRTGINHNFTMDVNRGTNILKSFEGGTILYATKQRSYFIYLF